MSLVIIILIFFIFIIYFMRSPDRTTYDYDKNYMYSPTDGIIQDIYLKDPKTVRIVYFLRLYDNHTQYYPLKSKVIKITDYLGKNNKAYKEESIKNTNKETILESVDCGFRYNIIQRTGYIARRIRHYSNNNKEHVYNTGEKMGFILFGSRVDIDVPLSNIKDILIQKGQNINGIVPIIRLDN